MLLDRRSWGRRHRTSLSRPGGHPPQELAAMPNFRALLLGRRLSTEESHETRISNPIALAVFSSDALSSVAYGTQEIMVPLTAAISIRRRALRYPSGRGMPKLRLIFSLVSRPFW